MKKTKNHIKNRFSSRRQFLFQSGASLILPPLVSLLPRSVLAQSQTPVRRLIFLTTEFGMHSDHIFKDSPQSAKVKAAIAGLPHLKVAKLKDLDLDSNGGLSYMASPQLSDLFGEMNIYQGLDRLGDVGHDFGVLAGVRGSRTPSNGRTIDYIIESSQAFKQSYQGRLPTIRVMNSQSKNPMFFNRQIDPSTGLFKKGENTISWDRLYRSDGQVFFELFVRGQDSGGSAALVKQRKQWLVDAVFEDYKNLKNSRRLASEDKTKLNDYVERIQELQRRVANPDNVINCQTPNIVAAIPAAQSGSSSGSGRFSENICEMTRLAFACDASRMLSFHYHPFDAAHHDMDRSTDDNYGSKHQRQVVEFFAEKLIRPLKNQQDPINGGRLFDNCFFLFCNEHSTRAGHHPMNIPMMSFGDLGGSLKKGYLLDYRKNLAQFKEGGYPLKMLLVSLMRGMGMSQNEILSLGPTPNSFGLWTEYDRKAFGFIRHRDPYFDTNHSNPLPFLTNS